MRSIVIIGNGIAGITAARNIRKLSDDAITVISDECNFHYSRPALMYIFMGDMKFEHTKPYEDWFWKKNRIHLLNDYVENIDCKNKKLQLKNAGELFYDVLIIATGATPNKPSCKGLELKGVQGFYGLHDLEELEKNVQNKGKVIIVGGGLIGVEVAEMMHKRGIHCEMIVRERSYWGNVLPKEESEMIKKHILSFGINVHYSTELAEIIDDGTGKVGSIITNNRNEIKCTAVVLCIGVSPNISMIKNTDIECNKGVIVNEYFETNIDNVYAIGDCAEIQTKSGEVFIEPLWYAGRQQGESLASLICKEKIPYTRPIWYNSAKFFDIEYQVYGNPTIGTSLYYEFPDGKRSIRVSYQDNIITGFNLMGVRYRHQICEKWIRERAHIETVLSQLEAANFDPEFSDSAEQKIRELYAANKHK